jgi:hypothetical protein
MGYSRDTDRKHFFFQAAYQSWRAAWRWNKRISIKMLAQMVVWLKKSFL